MSFHTNTNNNTGKSLISLQILTQEENLYQKKTRRFLLILSHTICFTDTDFASYQYKFWYWYQKSSGIDCTLQKGIYNFGSCNFVEELFGWGEQNKNFQTKKLPAGISSLKFISFEVYSLFRVSEYTRCLLQSKSLQQVIR